MKKSSADFIIFIFYILTFKSVYADITDLHTCKEPIDDCYQLNLLLMPCDVKAQFSEMWIYAPTKLGLGILE